MIRGRRASTSVLGDIKARIRAAGLRATSARMAVYEKLLQAASPLSHAELADALTPLGYDRATVYRNLTDLTEVGLVRRTDLGDHVWRFELLEGNAPNKDTHAHFVCTDCGEVSCLSGIGVTISGSTGVPRAVSKKRVEVHLKGLCDNCA